MFRALFGVQGIDERRHLSAERTRAEMDARDAALECPSSPAGH
jgi:hypothetical protein